MTKQTRPAATKRNKSEQKRPSATLVFYVRHGKTPTTGAVLPGRAKGLHLAPEGVAQAERAAQRLASGGGTISAIYSSPMERTVETAKPIAKALGLQVKRRSGLIEADFGSWTGKKLGDLRKLPEWDQVQHYPSGFRFPDGESFAEMQQRIVGTVQDLARAHRGERIVVVSHADTIKAAVADALGTHLDLFQRIVVSQCSISAVLYGEMGPAVLTVNSTGEDLSELKLS